MSLPKLLLGNVGGSTPGRPLADRHPRAALLSGDAYLFQGRTVWRKSLFATWPPPAGHDLPSPQLLANLLERNFIFVSSTVRHEALDEVGGFDARIPAVADWEMWLRLAAHGHDAALTRDQIALYRRSPGQMSANKLHMETAVRDLYRVVLDSYPLAEDTRALSEAKLAWWTSRVASGGSQRPTPSSGVRAVAGRIRHRYLVAPAAARRALR